MLLDSPHLDLQTRLGIDLKEKRSGPDALLQILVSGTPFQSCRYPTWNKSESYVFLLFLPSRKGPVQIQRSSRVYIPFRLYVKAFIKSNLLQVNYSVNFLCQIQCDKSVLHGLLRRAFRSLVASAPTILAHVLQVHLFKK